MATYNLTPSSLLSDDFLKIWMLFKSNLKRDKTRYEYMSAVNGICEYCQSDFLTLTPHGIDKYFCYLARERKLSLKTLNSRYFTFHSISKFCYENRLLIDMPDYSNPFAQIQIDSYSELIEPAAIPTPEQIDTIFAAAAHNDMLYLIFSLIIRCSLSANEICSLRAEMFQLDQNDRMFLTFNKAHKERIVKVPSDVSILAVAYCNKYGYTEGPVFYNKKGKPMGYHALSVLVHDVMQAIGFSFTMQDLRNASMAYMLAGGADSASVAAYAGVSERWMWRFREVLPQLDVAPCDYQYLTVKRP